MRKFLASLAAVALVVGGAAVPADAQRSRDPAREDQASARQEMRAGRIMSAREIEGRIVPRMEGDYLGLEYDRRASAYRLKFNKEGKVTWVDVDARTGRVLRVSR